MPFPTTGVLDDFNRADSIGSLGSNWVDQPESGYSSLSILSNQCYANAGFQGNIWNVATFGANQEVYCDVPVMTVYRLKLYARWKDLNNNYSANVISTGAMELVRMVSGSQSNLTLSTDNALTVVSGDSVGLEVIGSTISCYVKHSGVWALNLQAIDTSITGTGKIGLHVGDETTVRIDNFGGGEIPASPLPILPAFPSKKFGPF